jgi:hypothetical protein
VVPTVKRALFCANDALTSRQLKRAAMIDFMRKDLPNNLWQKQYAVIPWLG